MALTNKNYQPIFFIWMMLIRNNFFICWNVCCVILFTPFTFIHRFIRFSVFSAQPKTSSETSCKNWDLLEFLMTKTVIIQKIFSIIKANDAAYYTRAYQNVHMKTVVNALFLNPCRVWKMLTSTYKDGLLDHTGKLLVILISPQHVYEHKC